MKTLLILSSACLLAVSLHAQTTVNSTATPISSETLVGYQIGGQDGNSRRWQKMVKVTDARGNFTVKTNDAYVELANGLNYWDESGQQWLESKEEIDAYPDGAIAQFGQHKVIFANNLNTAGAIDLKMPNGRELKSHVLGLGYYDSASGKSVLIAQVKDCQGQIANGNQVVYADAFEGVHADVRYTYKRGSFEQDVILQARPPAPESFGLSSRTAVLQVLTEFDAAPEPSIKAAATLSAGGLMDQRLDFGAMKMVQGRAFGVRQNPLDGVRVSKQWQNVNGRTILIESLPVASITNQLNGLAMAGSSHRHARTAPRAAAGKNSNLNIVSSKRLLPAPQLAKAARGKMKLAMSGGAGVLASRSSKALVLDYQMISGLDYDDFTFQADTTYYISGEFIPQANVYLQGGAVIKYPSSGLFGAVDLCGTLICQTDPCHPAIFTEKDDNSVGEPIGTGTPVVSSAEALMFDVNYPPNDIENTIFRYCRVGVDYADGPSGIVRNCQFINDTVAIVDEANDGAGGGPVRVENALFSNISSAVFLSYSYGTTLYGANLTVHHAAMLVTSMTLQATNSLFICVTNLGNTYTGAFNATNTSDAGVFESAALGNEYLATNIYRDVGTTSIASSLLAELQQMTTYAPPDGGWPDTNAPDLGYHYPVNEDSDFDSLPDWWEWKYFGSYTHTGSELDSTGGTNTLLYDYQHTNDPNVISFACSFTNQYVNTSIVGGVITILGGVPASIAVLVDSTNFMSATWTAYTSSNVTVNLGSTQGSHDVWIGLRGLPADAQQTWQETTLVLDSTSPTITITNPVNNVSFNSSRVNICGNFASDSPKQITVNGVLAFTSGTNFEAVNVPLDAGTNIITAVVEDLTGATNITSINIIGLTNTDGSMNDPVDLQATPVAGFAPLAVTFTVQANAPGTVQQTLFDFNGDDLADFFTNNFNSITYTYATNGEYFPVVTIQTSAGRFSSIGGWNGVALDPSNQPVRINVQDAFTEVSSISITDPVDIKWVSPSNLYVLSGSTATITEFNTNGSTIRSLSGIGDSPSGFDVDASGNVYVAMTGDNQVWKYIPTNSSFMADTNFGNGGYIGVFDGDAGSHAGQFNAPFDVAVAPDGQTFAVSDSANARIQQFSVTNGVFISAFGTNGSDIGQFDTPKGLAYDSAGTLYIVDSGNSRIVLANDSAVFDVTGTNGTDVGQFYSPVNICIGERGVYVADTGNDRIQKFDLPVPQGQFNIAPHTTRFALSTNFSGPFAVAARDSLTNELFYVADTGNSRVVLYKLEVDNPMPVWTNMTMHVAAGDVFGAIPFFSRLSVDKYRQMFLIMGMPNAISMINQIGAITPIFVNDDEAEYRFNQDIGGTTVTFTVEFVKESGLWKILEF